MSEPVLNERIDDLLQLLAPHGYGSSRIELIRRAVFALPTEDPEQLARLLQYGGLRYREASGRGWSEEALAECELQLGWYSEDAEKATLVSALKDAKDRLEICASRGEAIADYARGGRYRFA